MSIEKVAVIGSGVMGAGIAAHVANAGFPVVLLDIVPEGAENRNQIPEDAVARQLKTGGFMHPSLAGRVVTGNLEDDLDLLADADWIIEAIIERLDIKSDLYRRIDAVRKPGSIVSSNTSTIPLNNLTEGQSEAFANDFLITHFFNPPRHMRLLELITGPDTRPDALELIRAFTDVQLGKGIVMCKDTPGFIANRIGLYWMQAALLGAFEHGVSVEEADAVMSRPVGIPKTGVFGLWDLVGIDLGPHLINSMTSTLSSSDPVQALSRTPKLVEQMIEDGYTGRKGLGGFYRMTKADGKKIKQSKNLESGEYQTTGKVALDSLAAAKSGLRALVSHEDRGGRYAWDILSKTLSYAASLVPEICDDIQSVDEAMRLGYAWSYGPFELIDQLGAAWFAQQLKNEGRQVPPLIEQLGEHSFYRIEGGIRQQYGTDGRYHDIERAEGVLLLSDLKLRGEPVEQNDSASLWDLGDGVACLEFHTKMNAVDRGIMAMIARSLEIVEKEFSALVLYNEGRAFSAGANLAQLREMLDSENWDDIRNFIRQGQQTYRAMQQAPFPVVGASSGMALGGGCEVLLHCDAVQAHAETYAGLVEVGVGLVPAWGGCKEMLKRWGRRADPEQAALKAFGLIATAKVSGSAADAQRMGLLSDSDQITMNRDRLLADAKAKALELTPSYQPPAETTIALAGIAVKQKMITQLEQLVANGKATAHDKVVGTALTGILSGAEAGNHSEQDLYALELDAFDALLRNPDTQARIDHMLSTGKPLRN